MCSTAKQNIKETYGRMQNINVTALMNSLYNKGVITRRERELMQCVKMEGDRMMFLLDNIIIPSLEAGEIIKFKRFLEIMEQSNDAVTVSIGKRLGTLTLCCQEL